MTRTLLLLFNLCLVCSLAMAQPNLKIAGDTIITKSEFLGTSYLLNGKKMSLPVMEWFMRDYASSSDAIQSVIITDQLSVATYTAGSVFLLGGLIINNQDKGLSNQLYKMGGITTGTGLLLQFISGKFKKKAVLLYNIEVKKKYAAERNVSIEFGPLGDGLGGVIWF